MAPILVAASALAQFAPVITKWLGGSDSSVNIAERVAGIATSVAGVQTPEEAIDVFNANAEKAYEFKMAIANNEKELELAYLQDRASARERDVAYVTAGMRNRRADFLAGVAITAFVACIFALFFVELPSSSARDAILILLGTLTAIVKDVYQFEFGTTRSSKEKDLTINHLSKDKQ